MAKILYLIFFLAGFIFAAHWDDGVDAVKEISPFAEKTMLQRVKKAVGQDLGSKVKRAYEDGKKAIQEQKQTVE